MSASASVSPPRMSVEQFLAWSAQQPGRHELHEGEVVAMAGERRSHVRMKTLVADVLRASMTAAHVDCEVFNDGMAVWVDDKTFYKPDATVRCGPPEPGDPLSVTDLIIVVDVVSPSSSRIDSGIKFGGYFKLQSVQHYLVVCISPRSVIHHRRGDNDAIETRIVRGGEIRLDPPGIELRGLFDAAVV